MTYTPKELPGEGTKLQMKISTTFTDIGQVTKIDGPEQSVEDVDTFHLQSLVKTTRPSNLANATELTFTVFYDPNDTNTHQAIRAASIPPVPTKDWKLIYADGLTTPSADTLSGYIKSWKETGIEVDGNLQAEVTIKLTTVITFTAGTP